MDLLVFGHHGAPVIVFPTSRGRFFEYQDRDMVDSIDAESWYCDWAHPSGRVYRHVQYDQYLLNEVIPFIRGQNDNPFIMTTGCSFGAYHAINFGLRHPEIIRRAIGLSGLYDLRLFVDGYYDDNFYFNNPIDYTSDLHDPEQTAATAGYYSGNWPRRSRVLVQREAIREFVARGSRQCAAHLGRLGARLAVLAANDPHLYQRPRLTGTRLQRTILSSRGTHVRRSETDWCPGWA